MTSARSTADFPSVPLPGAQRIEAIDTLRGFALLGILVMNITGIAFPIAAYFNPKVFGGPTGVDYGAWVFAHLFFDMKMMGIFSMLFGAGLVLMFDRAEAAGRPLAGIYYRRVSWLLVIGLLHAYLVWHGDILVTYALCGFVLFLFRRRSPRGLVLGGVGVLVFGALLSAGGGYAIRQLREATREIEMRVAAGEELTPRWQALLDERDEMEISTAPSPEQVRELIATMRGTPAEVLRENVRESVAMHTEAVPFMLFWRALALMLLGMGLMKAGVLSGQRPGRFYRRWAGVGLGLGLPLVAVGIYFRSREGYDFLSSLFVSGQFNYFGSVLVSLGYVGIVMHVCGSGGLPSLRTRLAAVGRMALTNYLVQSLVCVAVFHGYGLALFGGVSRFHLWWFILAIWILQLAYSPWWLARHRFGPAEWLWRRLTYGPPPTRT